MASVGATWLSRAHRLWTRKVPFVDTDPLYFMGYCGVSLTTMNTGGEPAWRALRFGLAHQEDVTLALVQGSQKVSLVCPHIHPYSRISHMLTNTFKCTHNVRRVSWG